MMISLGLPSTCSFFLAERSGFASLPQPATGLAASANTLRAPSRSGYPSGSDPPEVPAESDVRRRPASDKERRVGGSAHLSPVVAPPPRCAAVPRSSLSQLLSVRQGSGFSGIPVRLPISPGSAAWQMESRPDRKSTRLNSSHPSISYAVFCLKKKKNTISNYRYTTLL